MAVTFFLLALIAHVMADFALQSDAAAASKGKRLGVAYAKHGAVVFVSSAVALHVYGLEQAVAVASVVAISHVFIDWLKGFAVSGRPVAGVAAGIVAGARGGIVGRVVDSAAAISGAVGGAVGGPSNGNAGSTVGGTFYGATGSGVTCPVGGATGSGVSDAVSGAVGGAVAGTVGNAVTGRTPGSIGGSSGNPAKGLLLFLADQFAHAAVLIGVWELAGEARIARFSPHVLRVYRDVLLRKTVPAFLPTFTSLDVSFDGVLVIALAYLTVVFAGAVFVRQALDAFSIHVDSRLETNAGRYIGMAERALMLTLVLVDALSSIAFVLTAKSLARFQELNDMRFAEYYLVGTLTSAVVALDIGILARSVIQTL